ncbi:OCIA domain-containing protein 1 [Chaetodon auriga]|uniref:OCIA domain-containing protein 1 n=1 Tax=Chaetodon auriga TaxID=39042 RepID=UPI004032EF32
MSSTTTGFPEERQPRGEQAPVGLQYVPTEEERKVFEECNRESLWYRSVPFSVISMAITQALVARGSLSASPRFGSLPKVAFAGFFGYLTGKMSYMKTCQEKFKRLENSPLGEALRQRTGQLPQYSRGAQSELNDPDTQSFETMFQPAEAPSQKSFTTESPIQMGKSDDFSAPVESYADEEEPKRKGIFYEDLRLKNRENYEVTLTQKAETLLRTSPEKEPKRPKKEMKNIYGDTWEE